MLPAGLDRRQRAMRSRDRDRSGQGRAERRDMQPVAQRRPAGGVRARQPVDVARVRRRIAHARRAARRNGRDRQRWRLVARRGVGLRFGCCRSSSRPTSRVIQRDGLPSRSRRAHATVIGDHPVFVAGTGQRPAVIEPHVVFDATRRTDPRQRGSARSRVHADLRPLLRRARRPRSRRRRHRMLDRRRVRRFAAS